MEGWLEKRPQFSSSKWRNYYYRISGKSLREYRDDKSGGKHRKSFKLAQCVLNAGLSIAGQAGKPNSLALVPDNSEPVFFAAPDAKALEKWMFALSPHVKKVNKEALDISSFKHAVVTANTKGIVQDANDAFLSLLGYTKAEVVGQDVIMFMPKVLRANHHTYIEHYLKTGEKRLIGKPRKVKAVHKDGSFIQVLLCLDEITEGKDRRFVANFCVSDADQAAAGFQGLTASEMELAADEDEDDSTGSELSASTSSTRSQPALGGRSDKALRIHSGVLKKRTMFGRWKASWFVATREHLAEYASEKSTKPRARYAYKGMRLGTDASSMMGKANCFSVTTADGDTYFFQAASDQDMHTWTDALAKFVESQNTTMDVEWFKSATVCSDTTGKIIAVNSNAEEFFGYDRAEMLGQNVTMFMPDEIAQHHAGFLKRYLKSGQRRLMGKPRQFGVILKGGKVKTTLLCIGEFFENGERKFMANFCTNEDDLEQAGFDLDATEVAQDTKLLPAIHKGWLTSKTTFGKWKKRYCAIQSNMLTLSKNEEASKAEMEIDITESVIGVDASGFTNKPFCFSVTPSGSETIFFRCKSDPERAEWTDALAAFSEASSTTIDLGRIDSAAIMADETGKILALNPRAEDMFGYTKAELIGRDVSLLTPKVIARQHASFIQRYLDTGTRRLIGKPRVVNAVHKDKSTVRVMINLAETFEGDQRRFLAQFELDSDELRKRKIEGQDSEDSDLSDDSGSGSANSSGVSSGSSSSQLSAVMNQAVIKEGSLRSKPLFGRWSKGYFVIRASTLFEFESKAKQDTPLNHSDISKCNVADATSTCNRPWCFSLTLPGKDARFFQAGSDEQMKEWMEVFEAFANSGAGADDIESYPYATVVSDDQCNILKVNKKLTKLLGFTKEECKGQNVTIFMPKAISAAHAGYINRYNKTREARLMGRPRRLKAVHKSGMFVDVLLCLSEHKDKHGERRFMAHLKVDADEEFDDDDSEGTMRDAVTLGEDELMSDLGRTRGSSRRFMKTPPAGGRTPTRRSGRGLGTVELAATFKSGVTSAIEAAVNKEFQVVLEKINELESQKRALAEELAAAKRSGDDRRGSQGEMISPQGGKKKKKSLSSLFKFSSKDEEVHLVINEKLAPGGGSSAGVYSCTVNGWVCAMKELVIPQNSVGAVEAFEKEITLLESLPMHPNIARYLFHQHDGDRLRLFITRYSGTLAEVIDERDRKQSPFTLPEIARFLLDVVRGLHFLHQNKIMHRDLKSDNVFVMMNEQGAVQQLAIGDFDQSKTVSADMNRAMTCVGTPGYIAPEVLTGDGGGYGYAADVWSVGMLAYELLTLKRPYHNLRAISEINRMSMTGARPELPKDLDDAFKPIVELHVNCTERDPTKRPSLLELKNALVVASVPW